MPEYLAPGVYVEETSFRARSIEGVGTSTSAFVGPTRKGPIASNRLDAAGNPPMPPEMLTSFGDFVRRYGGLQDLPLGGSSSTNYLAHSVLNFFNEGGSRLYVVRVANGANAARKVLVGNPANPDDGGRVLILARFPGESGNGRVTIREILSTATASLANGAPAGSLMRARGNTPSEPARIAGGSGERMAVPHESVLRLMVNGAAHDVTFRGRRAEAPAADDLNTPTVDLDDANRSLTVTLDDRPPQTIQMDSGTYTPAAIALAINERLTGGYARLDGDRLVIGTDTRGHAGRVRVAQNDAFGFTADADEANGYGAVNNNLPDLAAFSEADLHRVLQDAVRDDGNPLVAASRAGGRLVISTIASGEDQTLAIADATDAAADPPVRSAHAFLGFTLAAPGDPPSRGSNVRMYRRQENGSWVDASDNALPLPAGDGAAVVGNLIDVVVTLDDADGETESFDEISLVASSPRFLGRVLGMSGTGRADALERLIGFDIGGAVNALALHGALFPSGDPDVPISGNLTEGLAATHRLTEGTNGGEPGVGAPTDDGSYAAAFEQLRGLEDVSIVAAPGHSAFNPSNYRAIQRALLSHVSLARAYRIAVLDTPPNQLPGEARQERAQIDSTHAALYYPWVTVANPLARPGRDDIPREINLPPSGFMCGIYARNDSEQSVAKAPANEVVRGALRFEVDVNFAQNQLLNPIGVNCLRFFPGRGFRVWGARTAGSDPEFKYVNVRRYFLYLEASIDRGTQWVVFENNGDRLWANVRETVESFLYNEWSSGNLLGRSPKEAFFVRCDRSTMTQNDLDNGRLICLVGVAVLKPAEFVIIRIGQMTADARN
jgi:uncharacterized protein